MKLFQHFRALSISLLLGAVFQTTAQTPILIKDIYPGLWSGCSICDYPTGVTKFVKMQDNRVFFFAEDKDTGLEPYITDGTEAGTKVIKDILTGTSGSITIESEAVFNPIDNKVYFFARKTLGGKLQLFATDGTVTGTSQVNTTDYTQPLSHLAYLSGGIFFKVGDTNYFANYGTFTSLGASNPNITNLKAYNGDFYYGGQLSNKPVFYRSDFKNGKMQIPLSAFTDATIAHAARDPQVVQNGLLLSTETESGIVQANIYFYNPSSNTCTKILSKAPQAVTEGKATDFKGKSYFMSNSLFYETDGTVAGTNLLRDFSREKYILGHTDTHIFLSEYGGSNNLTAYSPKGGFVNLDAIGESSDGLIREFVNLGDKAYFIAKDPLYGSELWESNGTNAGTKLLVDIYPGTFGSDPQKLSYMKWNGKNQILFWANGKDVAVEPFRMEVQNLSSVAELPIAAQDLFTINPNPAHDQVTITLKKHNTFIPTHWALCDLTGRVLQRSEIDSNISNININIQGLNTGLYLVHLIESSGKGTTQKLLID